MLILILALLSSGFNGYCQKEAKIVHVDFSLVEGKLIITYDLSDYKSNDRFNIIPEVYKVSGEKLNAASFSGDLNGVNSVSGNRIVWDIEKDNIVLDDEIYVILKGEVINIPPIITIEKQSPEMGHVSEKKTGVKPVSRAACFFESLIFPGWGTSRLTLKNWHFVKGILGYGTVISSLIMSKKASESFDAYSIALTPENRDYLFGQMEKRTRASNILLGVAGAVWSVDLINVLAARNRTLSKAYSNIEIKIGYTAGYLNTSQFTCKVSF